MSSLTNIESYKGYIRFKKIFLLLLVVIMAATGIIAIACGSSGLSVYQVLATLLGRGTEQTEVIVFNIRLPRVITAIVAGTGLAVVGCVMQSLLKNPLASSSTLGVSQGAAFGAAFAIIALGAGMQNQTVDGVTFSEPYKISICAFAGSMMSTIVILVLSKVFWTFGNLGSTSWREIIIMTVVVAASLIYFMLNRWNYNAMQNGENTAKGLGVNVEGMRIVGMIVCSMTASVIVSYIGIINFIGLISPHLMRRVIGSDYRYLLPASAMGGAILLLLSDTAARLAVQPAVLPIGAITSFLGAPLFMYLIFKGGRGR